MRVQPPKTKKKTFTYEEFKKYFLKHNLIFPDGTKIKLQSFFPDENGWISFIWNVSFFPGLVTMFPFEHQEVVKEIIKEYYPEEKI